MMSYWLSTPLVPSGTVVGACAGHFRHPNVTDVVLNKGDELQVLGISQSGRLVTVFKQPALCQVRELKALPCTWQDSTHSNGQGLDHLVALLRTGSLAVLRYNHQLNRFTVIVELMLAAGNSLDKDHVGCRLAVSHNGSCIALAAARGRIAFLNVTATASTVELSEPVVYAAAVPPVAGAVNLDRGSISLLELGRIMDIAFFSTSNGSGILHLAAISHRPGEAASELVLLQWDAPQQTLTKLGAVGLHHKGRNKAFDGDLGRALQLAPVPSCTTGVVVIGAKALLVLDCAAILQRSVRDPFIAVAATVQLFDLHLVKQIFSPAAAAAGSSAQQQQQQHSDIPCYLGKCTISAGPVRRHPSAENLQQPAAVARDAAATALAAGDIDDEQQDDEGYDAAEATAAAAAIAQDPAAAAAVVAVADHIAVDVEAHQDVDVHEEEVFEDADEFAEQEGGDLPGDDVDGEEFQRELQDDAGEVQAGGDTVHSEEDEEGDEVHDGELLGEDGSSDGGSEAYPPASSMDESDDSSEQGEVASDNQLASEQVPSAVLTCWAWQGTHATRRDGTSSSSSRGTAAAAAAVVQATAEIAATAAQLSQHQRLATAVDCLLLATAAGLYRLGLATSAENETAAAAQFSPLVPPELSLLGSSPLHVPLLSGGVAAASSTGSTPAAVQSTDLLVALQGQQLLAVTDSSSTVLLLEPSERQGVSAAAAMQISQQQQQQQASALPDSQGDAAAARVSRVASPAAHQLDRLHLGPQPAVSSDLAEMDLDQPHGAGSRWPAASAVTAAVETTAAAQVATAASGAGGQLRSHMLQTLSPSSTSTSSGEAAAAATAGVFRSSFGNEAAPVNHAAAAAAARRAPYEQQQQQHCSGQIDLHQSNSITDEFDGLPARYILADQLQLLGPISKFAVVRTSPTAGTGGSSSNSSRPVLVAASQTSAKGLRVLTPGTRVTDVVTGPEGMLSHATAMWALGSTPDSSSTGSIGSTTSSRTTTRVLVFSFPNASRALSVGGSFTDVSQVIGLLQHQATLFAACVAAGVAVQVTPCGVHLCCLEGLSCSPDDDGEGPCLGGGISSTSRQWRESPKNSRSIVQQQQQQGALQQLPAADAAALQQRRLAVGTGGPTEGTAAAAVSAQDVAQFLGSKEKQQQQQQQQQHTASSQWPWASGLLHWSVQDDIIQQQQQQQQPVEEMQPCSVQDHVNMDSDACVAECEAAAAAQGQQLQQPTSVVLAAAAGATVAVYLSNGELAVLQVCCKQQQQLVQQRQLKQQFAALHSAAAAAAGSAQQGPLKQQQQQQPSMPAAAAAGGKKRCRSSWAISVTGSLSLHKHVSCIQICTAPATPAAAAGSSVGTAAAAASSSAAAAAAAACGYSSSGSRSYSHYIITGSYTGIVQLSAVQQASLGSSSTSSSTAVHMLAQYSTEQLHPLRLLSKLIGPNSNHITTTAAAADTVSPTVPDSCLFIPSVTSCNARQYKHFGSTGTSSASSGSGGTSRRARSAAPRSTGSNNLLVLISFRNGDIALYEIDLVTLLQHQQHQRQLFAQTASDDTQAAQADAALGVQHLRVLSHLRLPGAPAKLQLLDQAVATTAAGPAGSAGSSSSSSGACMADTQHTDQLVLVVGDGMWMLQISCHTHQMHLRHVAAPAAALAAAVQLPSRYSGSSSSSAQDKRQQQQSLDSTIPDGISTKDTGNMVSQQQQQQMSTQQLQHLISQQQRRIQHVACVLPTGQLHVMSLPLLQQQHQHKQQTWLQGVDVADVATHPGSQKLLASCSVPAPSYDFFTPHGYAQLPQNKTWVQCLEPESGAKLAAYHLSGDQGITCLGFWDAAADAFEASVAQPRSDSSSSPEQTAAAGSRSTAAAAATTSALRLAELLRGLDSPSNALRFKGHMTAASAARGPSSGTSGYPNWWRVGPLVILGTKATKPLQTCKGQVIVLQLSVCSTTIGRSGGTTGSTPAHSTYNSYSFQRLAKLRLPEPVTAVLGYQPHLLLVAAGNVLAVYSVQQGARGQLQQAAHCFVRAPIVSFSVGQASSKLVFAADLMQGVAVYQVDVHAATGQVGIQAIAGHVDVRPVMQVACLPPLPSLRSAAAAAPDGGSSSIEVVEDAERAAAVARSHALCLDSRGYVCEVSWQKRRVVPVKCLSTAACMPLGGAAAAMQVATAAAWDVGVVTASSSSSSNRGWFCKSLYGLLDDEDIQLHWQDPLAIAAAAAGSSSNSTDAAAAAAAESSAVAAGVAACAAVVASHSGTVLQVQRLPAAEGRLLLQLQQLLLQHPHTRGLCIGAEHMLYDEQADPMMPAQPPTRLGSVDGRVLQQLLLLPWEVQIELLQSVVSSGVLPGRLARALRMPELQLSVLDALLCRLQLLPSWE